MCCNCSVSNYLCDVAVRGVFRVLGVFWDKCDACRTRWRFLAENAGVACDTSHAGA